MENKLLHYKPMGGNLGDCFPLYANNKYYIYYLNLKDNGTFVWSVIISDDLININTEKDILLPGDFDSFDQTLLSGCVFYDNGIFHAFYSSYGKNKRYNIMEATSIDGINFIKNNNILFEPNKSYEKLDTWRDPEIYYENGVYHMIFCAKEAPDNKHIYSGCIGYATSTDLKTWKLKKPLYSPVLATTLECPDLFKLNDKYILSYYWHDTKYRISTKLNSGYKKNAISSPTNFDFMAAKALQDEKRVIEFGWIPRKNCDCAERNWGGVLAIPKEIYFNKKNEIVCKFVDEIYHIFNKEKPYSLITISGNKTEIKNQIVINSCNDGSLFKFDSNLPKYLLSSKIKVSTLNSQIIFFIKCNSDLTNGYQVIFDFSANQLFIREQYRWDQRPNIASMPLKIKKNVDFSFEMVVNHDILEICIDKEQSLSFRMLKYTEQNGIALAVQDTKITLTDLKIYK